MRIGLKEGGAVLLLCSWIGAADWEVEWELVAVGNRFLAVAGVGLVAVSVWVDWAEGR